MERTRKRGGMVIGSTTKPEPPNILITAQREVFLTSSVKREDAEDEGRGNVFPVLTCEIGDQRIFFDDHFESKTRKSVRRKISSMFRPRSFTAIEE